MVEQLTDTEDYLRSNANNMTNEVRNADIEYDGDFDLIQADERLNNGVKSTNEDEVEDVNVQRKFKLNGLYCFVTWSQSKIEDHMEFYEKLKGLLPDGAKVHGGKELHADGKRHYHAVVRFRRKVYWTDARKRSMIPGDTEAIEIRVPEQRQPIRNFLENAQSYYGKDGNPVVFGTFIGPASTAIVERKRSTSSQMHKDPPFVSVVESTNEDNEDEVCDGDVQPKFKLSGLYCFVTWSQSKIDDHMEFYEKLQMLLPGGARVYGGKKLHADGKPHYHAVIKFKRRVHWTDARKKFMIEGDTEAIEIRVPEPRQSIREFLENTQSYCGKDDNPNVFGMLIDTASSAVVDRKWVFSEIDEEGVIGGCRGWYDKLILLIL